MQKAAGADSAILHDWVVQFIKNTESLQKGGQKLFLTVDSILAHVQFFILEATDGKWNLCQRNAFKNIAYTTDLALVSTFFFYISFNKAD